ncbi:Uncharacterised protein [uncultured archaeon]|nr:Uncharacterised protein [uncultured archaeon]
MTYHRSIAGRLMVTSLTVVMLLLINSIGTFAKEDLTGIWGCNDGGTYFIRQVGNIIWWYGESTPSQSVSQSLNTNPAWANVAYGTITGDNIVLFWADVPIGSGFNSGSLALKYSYNGGTDTMSKQFDTGGFGGSQWTRSASAALGKQVANTERASKPVTADQSKVGPMA